MPQQVNPLAILLQLAAQQRKPNPGLGGQIQMQGLNNLPRVGMPTPSVGGMLVPQKPLPIPTNLHPTRGEATTNPNNTGGIGDLLLG